MRFDVKFMKLKWEAILVYMTILLSPSCHKFLGVVLINKLIEKSTYIGIMRTNFTLFEHIID